MRKRHVKNNKDYLKLYWNVRGNVQKIFVVAALLTKGFAGAPKDLRWLPPLIFIVSLAPSPLQRPQPTSLQGLSLISYTITSFST